MEHIYIDVIIPCYNAQYTLERTLNSLIEQQHLGKIIIVDDGSTDDSLYIAKAWQEKHPHLIYVEQLAQNGGVARARNWGILVSTAPVVAFLDADDAYQPNVLAFAHAVMRYRPEIPMLRLALKPVGLAEKYLSHQNFTYAWRHVEMTVASNMVFRRNFLLACGGFPQDELFKRVGGEDVALSLAVLQSTQMGTAFEDVGIDEIAVLHYLEGQNHAYRLLDKILYDKPIEGVIIKPEDQAYADDVTQNIVKRLQQLNNWLSTENKGKIPLKVER